LERKIPYFVHPGKQVFLSLNLKEFKTQKPIGMEMAFIISSTLVSLLHANHPPSPRTLAASCGPRQHGLGVGGW
jgi:hypothetical protein